MPGPPGRPSLRPARATARAEVGVRLLPVVGPPTMEGSPPHQRSWPDEPCRPVGGTDYEIYALDAVEGAEKLPYSLKILLENLLRTEDGANITADHVRALANWDPEAEPSVEIQFTPGRVIMQDFTGVPCVVD